MHCSYRILWAIYLPSCPCYGLTPPGKSNDLPGCALRSDGQEERKNNNEEKWPRIEAQNVKMFAMLLLCQYYSWKDSSSRLLKLMKRVLK
jgi:hypothetical protein